MSIFHTACSIAKRSQETFVQWANIGGERQRIEFQKDIIWLLQSEAAIRFMHGGEVIKEGGTYNDFFGYLTSFNDTGGAISEASLSTEVFSATPESSMSIEVVVTVMYFPCVETKECAEVNRTKPVGYKSQFAYVPNDWRCEVVDNGETLYPVLKPEIRTKEVVWSSKNTPEQNAELETRFIEAWRAQ